MGLGLFVLVIIAGGFIALLTWVLIEGVPVVNGATALLDARPFVDRDGIHHDGRGGRYVDGD